MATTISTQDIVDAKRDIEDIGKAVNEKVIVSPRYGDDFKSLPMIADEGQASIASFESTAQNTIDGWESAITLITQDGGIPALAVSDASGNTQQNINDNTTYFYRTVAAMIADESLTDGKVVATRGYHNISDDGGAIYLISSTATNYSIPLANGLHAVFRDSFDIRKFGIRDSKTLDQTAELQRMAAYADSRFYEIDFHNFNIMTPDITHFTTVRGSIVKGLGFHFVHEIKNLNIVHDKTNVLQQGTCNLLFLPKSNTGGTFKLNNVTFDPYVTNFNIISGEYDGMMCGFLAKAHPEWVDFDLSVVSDFHFDFKGIKFKSPAVSYNMSTAGIFSRSTNLDSLSGDYWGLCVNTFAKRLTANNVRGVFRNDLHAGSGRLLVTSLIHEEPELGSATVSQDDYVIRNCSSLTTSGEKHILFKHDSVGRTHFKSISVDNCIGSFEIYDFDDDRTEHLTTVDTINVSNRALLDISLICIIGQLNVTDVIESYSDIILDNIIGRINIKGGLILNNAMGNFSGSVDSVHADLLVVNNETYGLARSNNISIKSIEIGKLILDSNKLVECKFDSLIIHDFEQKFTGVMNNTIFNVAPVSVAKPFLQIGGFKTLASNLADFVLFSASSGGDAVIFDSNLPTPMIFTYASTISLKSTRVRASKIINPDSIPVAGSYSTTFIVQGAKSGAIIDAAFSQFNENIAVRGYISSENTVTVTFKNTGSSPVDLAEGILTIEISQ